MAGQTYREGLETAREFVQYAYDRAERDWRVVEKQDAVKEVAQELLELIDYHLRVM